MAAPRLTGSDYGAKFGYSLAAGDWDGDGAADLVAGAPLADGGKGAADAGAVHVYYAPAKTVSGFYSLRVCPGSTDPGNKVVFMFLVPVYVKIMSGSIRNNQSKWRTNLKE